MSTQTQHGYLVLADISGYTAYLAGVELDHAHEILTDLLTTIVNLFKTVLTISKLEGDAVLLYAVKDDPAAWAETKAALRDTLGVRAFFQTFSALVSAKK